MRDVKRLSEPRRGDYGGVEAPGGGVVGRTDV
jgi:hypothetical protein